MVVRAQKQEKLINILRILTMLSYFLDQVTSPKLNALKFVDETAESSNSEP